MKIAVTGASGFLGRHAMEEFARLGITPTTLHRSGGKTDVKGAACFDIHESPGDAYQLLGEPETLLHLAWGGLPNYNSRHHFERELPGQYDFLKRLISGGLKNLVITGTCFEYGFQSGPLKEDSEVKPANSYAFAKDCLHKQLRLLQRDLPFNLIWLRVFYPWGDGQGTSSLFSQLKGAVSSELSEFNMSGGEQLRDYMPVSEMAKILARLCLLDGRDDTVNLCSGFPVSVRRLVEGWLESYGWKIKLNLGFYPYPTHEPMAFWGMRDRLNNLLHQP